LGEPGLLVGWIVHGGAGKALAADAADAVSTGSATSATIKPVSHRAREPARRSLE
jgi:hypothetical protein